MFVVRFQVVAAMVLKGGPAGEWHCQLDNGTFELMIKGRNFFPDAGSYSYGGDAEIMKMRNWFRQTRVHNTLTLNDANLEKADTKCLFWKNDGSTDVLVTENPSYKNLTHRRSVFFVDKKFYVIVDEALGSAVGKVGIHFAMCEGDIQLDTVGCRAVTKFKDGNNLLVKTFANQKQSMSEEEGWVSYVSKQKVARKAFSFNVEKKSDVTVRFITVIYPLKDKEPSIRAEFTSKKIEEKSVGLSLKIDEVNFDIKAEW